MKKDNKFIFGLILGIIAGGLICSGIVYYLMDQKYIINQNVENNKEEEKEDNHETEINDITSISQTQATQKFNKILNKRSFMIFQLNLIDSNFIKIDDMSSSDISVIISSASDGLEYVKVCNTKYEQQLMNIGIIDNYGGQTDCVHREFIDSDSIKDASIKLFGKSFDKLFDSNNVAQGGKYYYYEPGNISVMPIIAGEYQYNISMSTYYIENKVLTIEFTDNVTNKNYKLNFKISGENFYFEIIERLS